MLSTLGAPHLNIRMHSSSSGMMTSATRYKFATHALSSSRWLMAMVPSLFCICQYLPSKWEGVLLPLVLPHKASRFQWQSEGKCARIPLELCLQLLHCQLVVVGDSPAWHFAGERTDAQALFLFNLMPGSRPLRTHTNFQADSK